MRELKKTVSIMRCHGSAWEEIEDQVVTEQQLTIRINGSVFQSFVCTPNQIKELVFGLLFAHGLIHTPEDVSELEWKKDQVWVSLKEGRSPALVPVQASDLDLSLEELFDCSEAAATRGELFAQTGGAHYGGIYYSHKLCCFAEDISRKNALAKTLGIALLEGIAMEKTCLITSGRVSRDIAVMTATAGVSILLSRSAPTDLAIEIARGANLTLCGFVRGKRLNIYSAEHRILKY